MSRDDAPRMLREAIEEFGAERAPQVIVEARAEAVAKARATLAEAMTESLLSHCAAALRPQVPQPSDTAATRPAKRSRRRRNERPKPSREGSSPDHVSRPPSQARPAQADAGLAYYVYGVVFAGEELPAELAGVDSDHTAFLVEQEHLAAIVSRVSLDEFGEERLRANLNDVEWLEDKARAHEQMLDAALQRTTVVPMRLCTIYSSEAQVRSMLADERAVLVDALERLAGKAEWGAKVIAAPHVLQQVAAQRAGAGSETDDQSTGTAYMARKKRAAVARDEEDLIAEEWALAIHERLAQTSSEALLNPLQRPEVSGHEGEMILNGVYLVEDDGADELRAQIQALQGEYEALGVSLELTGPWPPYNFVKSSIEAAR